MGFEPQREWLVTFSLMWLLSFSIIVLKCFSVKAIFTFFAFCFSLNVFSVALLMCELVKIFFFFFRKSRSTYLNRIMYLEHSKIWIFLWQLLQFYPRRYNPSQGTSWGDITVRLIAAGVLWISFGIGNICSFPLLKLQLLQTYDHRAYHKESKHSNYTL